MPANKPDPLDCRARPIIGLEPRSEPFCKQKNSHPERGFEMTSYSKLRSSIAALFVFGAGIGFGSHASADAIADIKSAGQINVGIFSDFPPFSSARVRGVPVSR